MLYHYQNHELPWRSKSAKKYTKTAKETVLGGRLPSKMRQEWRAKETRFPWQPAAKNHFLGGSTAPPT